MNENRSIFALDGITGMLIATALLLSILAGLTISGISVQHENASNYYKLDLNQQKSLKTNSVDNAKMSFIDAK